ncbi:MAG: PQQ-binding-like beta-propeller repeat protein [Pirellulaceae bacterium]
MNWNLSVTVVRLIGLLLLAGAVPAVIAADPAPAPTPQQLGMSEQDWPWWRGPQRNGHANSQPAPPTTWSDSQNIQWKVPVPGKGHGSPTVVGDRIFLATSDPQQETQSVLFF